MLKREKPEKNELREQRIRKGNQEVSRLRMLALDALAVVLLIAFDQWTKYQAILRLKGQPAFVLIDGALELQYLENRGSAFGMLQDQKYFILFVGIVFMAAILFFLLKLPNRRKFNVVHMLLSMVIAGGAGNMIDRFRFDYVVDFISFVLINYPIFNVADIYIVVSAVSLFVIFMFVFKESDLEFLNFKQNRYREIK